jgi:hypothetical protein
MVALVIGVSAFLLLFGGCVTDKEKIDIRVDAALMGLKETGLTRHYQTALCMWAEGAPNIADRSRLEKAMTGYEIWMKEKEIKPPITTYEIKSIEIKHDVTTPTAIATVTIDGKEYKIKVCDNSELSWEK